MYLGFGLSRAIPDAVTTAWGARLIYPDDLVFDRQSKCGQDSNPLIDWLNGNPAGTGAISKAQAAARRLNKIGKITRDGDQEVVLHYDELGVIVACPNSSHGYLYVAGWLHHGQPQLQPGLEYERFEP